MQFISEMVTVMETTKKVLESAYAQLLPSYIHCSDSVEKLQELTDDIEDKKASVSEMMEILTEIPEDEIDDLEKELDAAMEEDRNNGISYSDVSTENHDLTATLPNVPTTIITAELNEDDDLEASLENLCIVSQNKQANK